MEKLLQSKGFNLNTYPEGKFWELVIEDDGSLKEKICRIFNAEIEVTVSGTDVETLILQCAEDFTKCIFYYDCNPFDMKTEDFMKYDKEDIVEGKEVPNDGIPVCSEFTVVKYFLSPEELVEWVRGNTSLVLEEGEYHIEGHYLPCDV